MTELGGALESAERLSRAESAAASINGLRLRAWSLTEIAARFASNGQPERAAEVVEDAAKVALIISNPASKAVTLREMDESLANTGIAAASGRFHHLCGQVLASQFWRDALPMVCRTDPHAFARLADLLIPPVADSPYF
jgi:hypothetical protein